MPHPGGMKVKRTPPGPVGPPAPLRGAHPPRVTPDAAGRGTVRRMTDPTPSSTTEAEELERLRGEVSRLRGELETQRWRGLRTLAVRKVVAAVLVVVAAFGAVASVIGIWGARTSLNTDRWVSTVAPLPQDPQVADAVSTYVTREVLRVLDVRDRIAGALPPNAAFLATPVTGR